MNYNFVFYGLIIYRSFLLPSKSALNFASGLVLLQIVLFNSQQIFAQEDKNRERTDELNAMAKKSLANPDSLYYYSNAALKQAKEIGYKGGEAEALKLLGIYSHFKGNFNDAINLYQQALAYFESTHNELETGKLNLNIATSYNAKLDYINSTTYALEALKSFKKLNDVNGEGRVLNLLGIVSHVQKNYRESLNYFKRYQKLAFKADDHKEIGSSFNNIGSAYERLGLLDSAILSYKKALIYKSKNSSKTDVGTVYQNIGGLYHTKNNEKQALFYHLKSKDAYEADGSKKWMSHSYYNIGLTYKTLKDTAKAKKWLYKAIEMAKKIDEKEILAESYEQLSKLAVDSNASEQDYKLAYTNLQKSVNERDSILDKDKIAIVEDLKAQYETEKKEQEIKDLNLQSQIKDLEISRKNSWLMFAIILIILLLISVWLFFNRRKIKNKITLQREIIKQQDIATKAVLDAEERERRRIATDLHDSVGQLLSAALMNLNGYIKNNPTEASKDNLEKSLALINESYDEMRTISHQMMPNALLKAGLTAAIREFLNKIDEKQLQINLDISGFKKKLDDNLETVLYRVIQESVNNVIKHARATKLSIQLQNDNDGISLAIEDNGIGFDQNMTKDGIGLNNIKSRIAFIKGSVEYQSAPGKGTLVSIFISV